jgi:hypothetical protein
MNVFDYLKIGVGGAAGAGLCLLWAFLLHGPAEYRAGQNAERQAAIARANDLIVKMEKDNAEVGKMDHRAKCAEFGFEWLPDRGCY